MGVPVPAGGGRPGTGWPTRAPARGWAALAEEVARHAGEHPLEPGLPVEALRQRLGPARRALVAALLAEPPGCRPGRSRRRPAGVGGAGRAGRRGGRRRGAGRAAGRRWTRSGRTWPRPVPGPGGGPAGRAGPGPPGARRRGPGRRAAAAGRTGSCCCPAPTTRAAGAGRRCRSRSRCREARQALDTTRRVAVPLLELLDRRGLHPAAARRPAPTPCRPTRSRTRLSATHVGVCRARVCGLATALPVAERVLRVEHLERPAVEPAEELREAWSLTSSLVWSHPVQREAI